MKWKSPVGVIIFLFCLITCLFVAGQIKLDADRFDFGEYPANETKTHTFTITNTGSSPLHIKRIRKTCGCLTTKLFATEIAPGQSTKLKLTVVAETVSGKYDKIIYIESNATGQRFYRVSISGNAQPLLNIHPSNKIYIPEINSGSRWEKELTLETTEQNVKFGNALIAGNVKGSVTVTPQADNKFLLKIVLFIPKAERLLNCKIKLPIAEPVGWNNAIISITGQINRKEQIH